MSPWTRFLHVLPEAGQWVLVCSVILALAYLGILDIPR